MVSAALILSLFIIFLFVFVAPVSATSNNSSAKGSPIWNVDPITLNLYLSDIPLWYSPAIGPELEIRLSYNSRSAVVAGAPFGDKWVFNYGSYLKDVNGNGTSIKIVMPDGKKDIYTKAGSNYTAPYGVFNNLTSPSANKYELTLLDGTVYTYDIAGTIFTDPHLVKIQDGYGNIQNITYSGNQIASVSNAAAPNTLLSFSYDGSGHIQYVYLNIANTTVKTAEFQYTSGSLSAVKDMGGYWTNYEYETNSYDAGKYLKTVQYPRPAPDAPITYQFKIEASGGTNTAPYPAPNAAMGNNYRITITDPLNNKEEYFYAGISTWHVSPKDYVAYETVYKNNRTHAAKTNYIIDRTTAKPRIKKITYPAGGYTKYENFDTVTGKAKKITHYHGKDANNADILHVDEYTYNANGRILTHKDPRSKITTYAYYPNNIDLQRITNPLGSISFTYNGSTHDIATVTDRLNNVTELTYNTYGQMTTITEAKNTQIQSITELVYEPVSHNLTEIKKAGSILTTLTYDTIGRVQTQTDAAGITTSLEYNNLDKVTKVTFPDTRFIQINRSTLHPHLIDSVTDRGGQTTTYIHDALNRLTRISGPQGMYDYQYDKNGNMTKLIDSNRTPAVETVFGYDLDDRLIRKTYADGRYLTYAYDKAGLLTTTTNARSIATTFTYDQNHNLLKTDYADTTPDVTNTYDDYNRLSTRTDGTGITTYGYDNNGRLISQDGPQPNDAIMYQYDELGRVKALLPQTGQSVNYNYDLLGRLSAIQSSASAITSTYSYTYSGASQVIQSLTRPNGSYTEYQYNDPLKKLTAVINKKSTGDVINKFEYTYNTRDLIATETITNGQIIDNFVAGTTTETPNILNQIMSRTAQGQTKTYAYDFDGNLAESYTADGYKLYMTYDAQNRMKSAEYTDSNSIAHRTEYSYAGDSLLAEIKKFDAGTPTGINRYLRSGFLPVQERDGNNNVSREYAWGLNLGGGIGGLLGLRQSGQDYSYLYDGKGNVSALIDSTQSVVASYAYDPFGRLMKDTSLLGFDQPYKFSTKPQVPETGHVIYDYRTLDSCSGKWTTRDPIEEEGGINLYQFNNNSAMNWIDPFGLSWTDDALQGTGDLAAGFGDLISFGGTAAIRQMWEANSNWRDPTNSGSFNYGAGRFFGDVWWAAAAAEFAAGWRWMPNAKGFEKAWSKDCRTGWHRLPKREGKWWSEKNLPHYHRRPGIKKHRPYERGF